MNYFPELKFKTKDLGDLIPILERANSGVFDENLNAQGARFIAMIKGIAYPNKFDDYFLHDTLDVGDALFILNGILPPNNNLLDTYLFSYQFETVSAHKNSSVIDKALNYCKQEMQIYKNSKSLGYSGVCPMPAIQRLDGLSTHSFREFPYLEKFKKNSKTLSQSYDRGIIEETITQAITDDLFTRVTHAKTHIDLWNTGNQSSRPPFNQVINWAQSKGFKSDWLYYLKYLEQELDDRKALNQASNSKFIYDVLISKQENRAKAVKHFLMTKKLPPDWTPDISLPALWDVLERERYPDRNGKNLFSSGRSNAYKFFKRYTSLEAALGNK